MLLKNHRYISMSHIFETMAVKVYFTYRGKINIFYFALKLLKISYGKENKIQNFTDILLL